MHKELIKMINNNNITVNRFFTMDPFSSWTNKQFSKFSTEINFFDDMNVITPKTIERLATLAKISIDDSYNTLIVTGYCGSGKTNFLRLCEAIIKGTTKLKTYNEICQEIEELYDLEENLTAKGKIKPEIFGENSHEEDSNERLILKNTFQESLSKIKSILYTEYFSKKDSYVSDNISNTINKVLKGQTIYLDFDSGKRDQDQLLAIKLTRHIEQHLKKLTYEKIKILKDFYLLNNTEFDNAFEDRSQYLFCEAISFICEKKCQNFDEYKKELSLKLNVLAIDQLLCIEVLLKIVELLHSDFNDYVYYFLDNIDIISNQTNEMLRKTISKFWDFTSEMQSLMNTLKEKNLPQNAEWIRIYNKFKYIFAMRETTAMHISDHSRTRIDNYSKHFDISQDTNKSFILKKRYNLLKNHIENKEITNTSFIKMVNCIEYITEDKYYKWNLFSLFNNDYRTTINCLCKICSNKESPIYQAVPLLKLHKPYFKFGGRGIIIKTICDSFKSWNYFSDLKVSTIDKSFKESEYNITLIRIILTVLYNMQLQLSSSTEIPFFVNREQSVSIKQLYDKIKIFCNDKETFLSCIEQMFVSRTWAYWNHLITFDNMLEYSNVELLNALNDTSGNKNIYIRCTDAGERFLSTLCIHYEYFSCRFTIDNMSLFSKESYKREGKKYYFENQISEVFNHVKACCTELKLVNSKIMESSGFSNYSDIITNGIFVKDKKFHEERIIHNHISYLDAYRLYLINGPLKTNVQIVNKILIKYIKDYLNLLMYDENVFYSENSQKLYKQLNACIQVISKKRYNDKTVVISRDYYNNNIKKTRKNFLAIPKNNFVK